MNITELIKNDEILSKLPFAEAYATIYRLREMGLLKNESIR